MVRFLNVFFLFYFLYSSAQSIETNFSNIEEVNKFRIPDSLRNKSYDYLENKFYSDSIYYIRKVYAKTYIKKGFGLNDSLNIAKGYYFLSVISEESIVLSILNRGLDYSKSLHTKEFPAILYYNKGRFYFNNANYKEALNNYFISFNLAKQNNLFLADNSKFCIGLLKSRIGKYEEALKIFKESYNYVLSEESEYSKKYFHKLIPLMSLSDTYTKLNKLDTATSINVEGIRIALENNSHDFYHYFVMNEGVNLFFKKDHKSAIDSLQKALPNLIKLQDQSNILFCRLYLGKSLFEHGKKEDAIVQFRTMDTLFEGFKDVFPEIRDGYKLWIHFCKTNGDKESQLQFLNRLISVDSILNTNYKYINEKIIKNFDTQNLVQEKEQLISDLNQANYFKSSSIILLSLALIIVSIFLIFNYYKRQGYRRKFEELIKQENKAIPTKELEKEKRVLTYLSADILKIIKKGLEEFKSNQEFLNHNVSMNSLAKNMDTNSKYLSVYINQYEQKKFTDYINDLRIEYTIEKLKVDQKFRKYTIKAIAEEVGFSNPISFSQAFYKNTEIKPSFFIRELENG